MAVQTLSAGQSGGMTTAQPMSHSRLPTRCSRQCITVGLNLLQESHQACTLCCRHRLASSTDVNPTPPRSATTENTAACHEHHRNTACTLTGRVGQGEEQLSAPATAAPATPTHTHRLHNTPKQLLYHTPPPFPVPFSLCTQRQCLLHTHRQTVAHWERGPAGGLYLVQLLQDKAAPVLDELAQLCLLLLVLARDEQPQSRGLSQRAECSQKVGRLEMRTARSKPLHQQCRQCRQAAALGLGLHTHTHTHTHHLAALASGAVQHAVEEAELTGQTELLVAQVA